MYGYQIQLKAGADAGGQTGEQEGGTELQTRNRDALEWCHFCFGGDETGDAVLWIFPMNA